jgi:hypothetical protein
MSCLLQVLANSPNAYRLGQEQRTLSLLYVHVNVVKKERKKEKYMIIRMMIDQKTRSI